MAAQNCGRQDTGKELSSSEDKILAAEDESCGSCLLHPVKQDRLPLGKLLVWIFTKECRTVLKNDRSRSQGRYVEPEGERCYEEKRESKAGQQGCGKGVPSDKGDWD